MPIKPARLNPGDRIGLITPASPPPDKKAIDYGIGALEKLGFKVKLGHHARKRHGFLAGTDRERAADLMSMFQDRKVNGIICIRGGYGTARLLPLLDYGAIRANPKVFVGYSDVTSLHFALLKRANLVSFHGPMINSDFIREKLPHFTLESFLRNVSRPEPSGSILQGHAANGVTIIHEGVASGRLIGGNLSLIGTTIGTPYQPSFRRRILFLEDVEEPPYRFDRMLTHLLNCGLLQQVSGIAIGINANCEDSKAKDAREYRQTLLDVLKERLRPLGVPVLCGLPFGHVPLNATLPIGLRATINTRKRDLTIEEAPVV